MPLKYLIKFNMHLLHYSILMTFIVIILSICITPISPVSAASTAGKPSGSRPLVYINKCCPFDEYLESNQTCIIGPSPKWIPSIYLMVKKKLYEPRGEAPPFIRFIENTKSSLSKCNNNEIFIGDNNKFLLFSNGSLFITSKSLIINPNDYCVDKDTAFVCYPQLEGHNTVAIARKLAKVKKCCTRDFVYNRDNRTCVSLKNGSKHPLNRFNFINTTLNEINYGFPDCVSSELALAGIFNSKNFDTESGNITLESGRKLKEESFCIEHTIGKNLNDIPNFGYGNINNIARIRAKDNMLVPEALSTIPEKDHTTNNHQLYIFTCSEHFSHPTDYVPSISLENQNDLDEEEQKLRFKLLPAGLLISVIFLIATLATGFLMPSNHHVLHWRCQSYYVGCLLIGDLLLATSQIAGQSLTGFSCKFIAHVMHFVFLAAFFWLNTMCFNIWWTFRDFRPTSLEKNQEVLRLRIYSAYAWGVPLVIVSVAAILDMIPDGDNFLRPRFGEKKCWFYGDLEILTYFFGPIGILLFINLLLFASTARQLTCGLWKIDDVKSTTEKAALGRVCLKLVIVMGVTWIADIVSWLVGGHWHIWVITDLINALQGVFIFIVVGCQPQVWSAVKRIWTNRSGRGVTTNTNGPQHSSSSHGLPSIGETVTNNTLTNTTSNTTSTKVPMETVC